MIGDITINGHTYTDADWHRDWAGTVIAISGAIFGVVSAEDVTVEAVGIHISWFGRELDEIAGLVPLAQKIEPSRDLKPFPARALRHGHGAAPLLFD